MSAADPGRIACPVCPAKPRQRCHNSTFPPTYHPEREAAAKEDNPMPIGKPTSEQVLYALATVSDYCDTLIAGTPDVPARAELFRLKRFCDATTAQIRADRATNIDIGRQLSTLAETAGTSDQAYFELGSLARHLTDQADRADAARAGSETGQ